MIKKCAHCGGSGTTGSCRSQQKRSFADTRRPSGRQGECAHTCQGPSSFRQEHEQSLSPRPWGCTTQRLHPQLQLLHLHLLLLKLVQCATNQQAPLPHHASQHAHMIGVSLGPFSFRPPRTAAAPSARAEEERRQSSISRGPPQEGQQEKSNTLCLGALSFSTSAHKLQGGLLVGREPPLVHASQQRRQQQRRRRGKTWYP